MRNPQSFLLSSEQPPPRPRHLQIVYLLVCVRVRACTCPWVSCIPGLEINVTGLSHSLRLFLADTKIRSTEICVRLQNEKAKHGVVQKWVLV